jgi:hypothetical protein
MLGTLGLLSAYQPLAAAWFDGSFGAGPPNLPPPPMVADRTGGAAGTSTQLEAAFASGSASEKVRPPEALAKPVLPCLQKNGPAEAVRVHNQVHDQCMRPKPQKP